MGASGLAAGVRDPRRTRQTWVRAAVAAAAVSKLDAVSRELGAIPPVAVERPQPFRNGPAGPSSAASKWQVVLSGAR